MYMRIVIKLMVLSFFLIGIVSCGFLGVFEVDIKVEVEVI